MTEKITVISLGGKDTELFLECVREINKRRREAIKKKLLERKG